MGTHTYVIATFHNTEYSVIEKYVTSMFDLFTLVS